VPLFPSGRSDWGKSLLPLKGESFRESFLQCTSLQVVDAVEKGLRTSPNSDSADCEDDLAGGGDDGAADWRPGGSVL
jgi:hypothetical protein